MIVKEYTITIRVKAMKHEDFPSVTDLVSGINDGLPEAWFSETEGDEFAIEGWSYKGVNNPKYLGLREIPIDELDQMGET